jgi:alpha-glucoside transport system substrate-binding protein
LVGCGDDDDDDDSAADAAARVAAAEQEAADARAEAADADARADSAEADAAAAAARAEDAEADAAAAAASAEGADLGTADVLGIWGGGDELARFEAMVRPWESATGGRMAFTGTRDLTELLTTRVAGGDPPDIAAPPELGTLRRFARDGQLVPLADLGLEDEVRSNYPEGFVDLGTVDGTLYAFAMKADTKGTIFYNPKLFADNGWQPLTAASSFDDLLALTDQIRDSGLAPWSMGIESGGASGWPATDWVQEIMLGMPDGAALNDGVVDGSIPFTDARVKEAWERWGEIALSPGNVVQGGATGINATGFVDASFPPFRDPPEAAMFYLGGFAAGFISGQFPDAVAGEDFDFFPFPGGGVAGGANLVYAFNDDETTQSLMQYLASAQAQQIWVNLTGFNSVHKDIDFSRYPDPVSERLARSLLDAQAFRFDLDDTIGGGFQQAFWVGATEYLSNPDDLDDILASIEGARGT